MRTVERIIPIKKLEEIFKIKRVAAYARVSCGKDAMLHSLSAQVSHYSETIQNTPGWKYAGVFADEGISGTKQDRPEFQRMLDDCRAGNIDMVLTKSISRFARNTLTTLQTVRELRALGVDVFFEEQNLHTLGGDGELLLTLLAAFAQAEADSASENQKWRIKANYEQGLVWSVTMYGFRQVDGLLEVVPEEAEILRLFADLYLEGYGVTQLSRALEMAGVRGRHGGIMRGNALKGLLFNEKTHGDLLLQKKYVNNPLDKKTLINTGERQQYFVQDSHEAIFDRDTYARLLAERERRHEKLKRRGAFEPQRSYPFSKKITCGHCGSVYHRKTVHNDKSRVFWMCGTFYRKGKAQCNAQQIPEAILMDAAAKALGLSQFDEYVFNQMVTTIRAPENGVLIFSLSTGEAVRVEWQNKSRRESWTPEMREAARLRALHQNSIQRTEKVVQ
jgi:DNA invertase Pin-like site-specific DNA recombinase